MNLVNLWNVLHVINDSLCLLDGETIGNGNVALHVGN